MMHITLITVGTLKESYLCEAVGEYKKRLGAYAKVSEEELKEERIVREDDRREVAAALEAEGERILKKIPAGAFVVALCVEGKMYSSETLAALLARAAEIGGKLCFIIGSSHGLSPKVKSAADLCLSVSALTFPHQLMRVMLYEILYRCATITAGKTYHK